MTQKIFYIKNCELQLGQIRKQIMEVVKGKKKICQKHLFWLSIFFYLTVIKKNMLNLDFELYTPKFIQIDRLSRENAFNF